MKRCCQSGGFYEGPMYQAGGFYAGPRYQVGGSIKGFSGPEYQLGGKWNFGQFLWRHAKPLLSFLGKKAVATGVDIGQDYLDGRNVKEAAKERLTQAGKEVASTALTKLKAQLQTGKGRRRTVKKGVRGKKRTQSKKKSTRVVRRKPSRKTTKKTAKKPTKRRTRVRKTLHTIFD